MLCLIESGIANSEVIDSANEKIKNHNRSNAINIPKITKEILLDWKEFFVINTDKAFLQDYYFVSETGKLVPINDFEYPNKPQDFEKICRFKITQMHSRATRMLQKY